ncbi:aminomethyl-transferring glycine dehydrogenase [Gammaproteobacteria bacterium]|nr:aminomethyl-transferring glycine dehydrogenase [Gammaproteobacteria bacterium]MDA8925236.1 aminomethyl-transferring glycine dehydrogenase [Gammaproteobacteria bacterium]MDA9371329.1 aminomethyl-transferring glycine dehydrogenase [Gammaproteobacteria bacterium]MDB4210605.1 aminomethyl-transferring glycine dehydrogenase [Gammaproteobacteria bacterium]
MDHYNNFALRHLGLNQANVDSLLTELGYVSLEDFSKSVLPENIFIEDDLALSAPMSEEEALQALKKIAKKNHVFKSFLGQGYYGTITPKVILRNVFENPGWYTSYTPYQPEISQGRLEALINFQTMIGDLTGLEIANASLLDEATAAAEAMTLVSRVGKSKSQKFFIDENCFPQTIAVVSARAKPIGIEVIIGDPQSLEDLSEEMYFGALIQYPNNHGEICDYAAAIENLHNHNGLVIMATDLMALTLLKSPGELGADIAIGSSQRFGVPLGFGGPHAAFMATKEAYKRSLPGRLVGASIDEHGKTAYRLALQTREQHIRREKATSNICTAQALLAIMAGFYAAYHGPEGLKQIAQTINNKAIRLAESVRANGFELRARHFFDTVCIQAYGSARSIHEAAQAQEINIRCAGDLLIISLDETTTDEAVDALINLFAGSQSPEQSKEEFGIPTPLTRTSPYLTHPVFHLYRTETEMLRYIRKLYDKDIALDRAMIPLGSCTMKLNATSEMIPVGWEEFSNIHPYAPADQTKGYQELVSGLEAQLATITGYAAISLQPNAGSQGEYAGLLAIDAFHRANNDHQRKICLIPESAHGTNPASAQMAGMKVVPVSCDKKGNIDLEDLINKAEKYSNELAAIMITYPSTHGVFETTVTEVCDIIHSHGGKVYIDGANLNAMVGLCKPGEFGGDVSHLNLHKTFCIPHGGGGPGVGPIGVVKDLVPHLPSDPLSYDASSENVGPVSATNFGSASILPISWMYIQMMGATGLRRATQIAILSANYIAHKLSPHYKVLYTGQNGLIAHECILDIRPLKELCGVEVDDIAKRLVDFGFHAPTMSFPVPGTLMIEPTESESLVELDRFIDAMISIRQEIRDVEDKHYAIEDSPLRNAPHCAEVVTSDNWNYKYPRSVAAYPAANRDKNKYWPPVGRIDNVYGDRNLMCTCPSMSDFKEEA